MRTISIGPEINRPSWDWVGFDTSRELSKYYDIKVFNNFDIVDKCDVILIIKVLPPLSFINKAKDNGSKVIYCPIDFFTSVEHIQTLEPKLSQVDMILSHSERLSKELKTYCSNIHAIDHNNKYTLTNSNNYKNEGFVLWIGGCEHLPHLLLWLRHNPLNRELVLLTNHLEMLGTVNQSVQAARRLAKDMNMRLDIRKTSINGHRTYPWCERTQQELMTECKAAIDIKGDDFSQLCKPPTKAQQFISSGIPFATNSSSYSYEYFAKRYGVELSSPNNQNYWFSEDYWKKTKEIQELLKEDINLLNIGKQYYTLIETLF